MDLKPKYKVKDWKTSRRKHNRKSLYDLIRQKFLSYVARSIIHRRTN